MLVRITVAVLDAALRKQLRAVLARPDILVQTPQIRHDLLQRIAREPADVLIISQQLLSDPPKPQCDALTMAPDAPALVVLTDSADPAKQAALLAAGCDAVLFSGLAVEQLLAVLEPMIMKRRRMSEKFIFASHPLAEPRLADFVSRSPAMAPFMRLVPRVVRSDTTLLIEGETGVGKERLASAIHAEGPRAKEQFVALNCGALPEHLLESELFGHVRGAFTGATTSHRGWFERAHGGTIFLDEVAEIPMHLQVKLLRVLQERQIQPVGGEKTLPVDVRVIAASNRPLEVEIAAGRFRRDLYHRLSVVTVTLPPLRERVEDIPALTQRLIELKARELRRRVRGIGPAALKSICSYPWPGNVRELNNVIERAILLCDDVDIGLEDLPASVAEQVLAPASEYAPGRLERRSATRPRRSLDSVHPEGLHLPSHWLQQPMAALRNGCFSDLERQYLIGVLIANRGRVGAAAKQAGLPARSLYEKMQHHNLRKEDFRNWPGSKSPARRLSPSGRSTTSSNSDPEP